VPAITPRFLPSQQPEVERFSDSEMFLMNRETLAKRQSRASHPTPVRMALVMGDD
jgi:hypothetical protein